VAPLQTSPWVRFVWSVVATSILACNASEPAAPGRDRQNLLLLTVDTLRSDHLSGYGYQRPTSPALDAFFETAVVFDDAHSNSSWTLPSLASLMTSLHPSAHGCINHKSRLDASFRTLAEILRDVGYLTAGIASHTFLREAYGLQQGFDSFDDELALNLRMSHLATSSPQVTQKVIDWLASQSQKESQQPWFLWAHYFDPHYVYVARPDAATAVGTQSGSNHPIDLYDGEVAFTDRQLGIVFERLAELDLADSTIVVFTSDHGEAFGEHGHDQHGSNLFREVTQVPLAIRAAGYPPLRVATPVEGIDVAPTVLALLGLDSRVGGDGEGDGDRDRDRAKPSRALAGRNLVAAMRGHAVESRPLLLETQVGRAFRAKAVIDGRWKLIADDTGGLMPSESGTPTLRPRGSEPAEPAWYLFDRELDPNEQVDVAATHSDIAARLRVQLDGLVAQASQSGRRPSDSVRTDLSRDEIESLRALGYLDGPALDPLRTEDPADRL
jgi:arylsulfatase A-like enzyme